MTETAQTAAYDDLMSKNRNLCDSIAKLVDEKADLQKSVEALSAANVRLADELKAVIAEKETLRKQLIAKSGMGTQENLPGTFGELRRSQS